MTLRTENSLAGYARAAVDLRARMIDYHRSPLAERYLRAILDDVYATAHRDIEDAGAVTDNAVQAIRQITASPWQVGEPYVCAPAMTAIVAAAAEALDLTGEVLDNDVAPCDRGVLFLPEPIYHRRYNGEVSSIGAITWARTTSTGTGRSCWFIAGWADHRDPYDPSADRRRSALAGYPDIGQFGPYVLTDLAEIPIGHPVNARPDLRVVDDDDRDWQPAPDGRYCIDEATVRTDACAAIAYAFWRIQAQPLATVAAPPIDRAARRRAARASITHHTRVVMLRRTSGLGEPTGEAKGTTASGSWFVATGGASSTRKVTPTASGSTPTSKAPMARRCYTEKRSPSSLADRPIYHLRSVPGPDRWAARPCWAVRCSPPPRVTNKSDSIEGYTVRGAAAGVPAKHPAETLRERQLFDPSTPPRKEPSA